MTRKKQMRGNPFPLIAEPHPEEYTGYPFITLLKYRDTDVLAIVDNVTKKQIKAFVLDLCGPEKVEEEQIINAASRWYYDNETRYPISFQFSMEGISHETSKIFKTFNVEYITRVIGPLPKFEMNEVENIKRRRRKPLPNNSYKRN